jgi:hypothetical protein
VTTLAGIDLGDQVIWTDRLSWSAIRQIETESLGGTVRVHQQRLRTGRPITLDCGWLPESLVADLCALRDSGAVMTLDTHGGLHAVTWRHGDGAPLESSPVHPYADPADEDWHEVIVRLVTV